VDAATPPRAVGARVRLGMLVPPVLSEDEGRTLSSDVAEELSRRYQHVGWDVEPVVHAVDLPAGLAELVDVARRLLLANDWDLAVLVTEVPIRLRRRPLLRHASPTHGVALVSLPAHGAWRVGARLRDSVADAVGALVGDPPPRDDRRSARTARRLVELATDLDDELADDIAFPARVIRGNLRLLAGMIRANRPWRLVVRLSRALVGALAVSVAALITSDCWRISATLGTPRLAALMAIAIAICIAALIVTHGLWERTADPHAREQVTLFNLTTLATLGLGVLSLYAEAFAVSLGGALLMVDSALFSDTIGRDAGVAEYLRLAWLVSSLATVGGAIGSALESDDAVREAAYAYRPTAERTDVSA
jgi:hypothetical protein